MTSGAKATNSVAYLRAASACVPTIINPHVAADGPTQFGQPLRERSDSSRCLRIVCGYIHQHTNAPHAFGLLRPRRERPRSRTANERHELAPFHVWMAPAWQEKM
jgi:hypothetical protein